MKRPKDLADRSRELRDVSGLPLLAARLERAKFSMNVRPTVGASFPTVKSNSQCGGFRRPIRE